MRSPEHASGDIDDGKNGIKAAVNGRNLAITFQFSLDYLRRVILTFDVNQHSLKAKQDPGESDGVCRSDNMPEQVG